MGAGVAREGSCPFSWRTGSPPPHAIVTKKVIFGKNLIFLGKKWHFAPRT